MDPRFKIFPTVQQLSQALCLDFLNAVHTLSQQDGLFFLALSGGNTPIMFFRQLAGWNDEIKTHPINWSRIHFFWVDERCVPPDHPDSNYGMTYENLLSRLKINPDQIHRIRGENDPVAEVQRYTDEIMHTVPLQNGLPVFDRIFLGIGEDGHTASLFPDRPDIRDSNSICEVTTHPVTGQQRISLTYKPINNARRITFLVTGKNKSKIISAIAGNTAMANQYPAYHVRTVHGTMEWYLDKPAAQSI